MLATVKSMAEVDSWNLRVPRIEESGRKSVMADFEERKDGRPEEDFREHLKIIEGWKAVTRLRTLVREAQPASAGHFIVQCFPKLSATQSEAATCDVDVEWKPAGETDGADDELDAWCRQGDIGPEARVVVDDRVPEAADESEGKPGPRVVEFGVRKQSVPVEHENSADHLRRKS